MQKYYTKTTSNVSTLCSLLGWNFDSLWFVGKLEKFTANLIDVCIIPGKSTMKVL